MPSRRKHIKDILAVHFYAPWLLHVRRNCKLHWIIVSSICKSEFGSGEPQSGYSDPWDSSRYLRGGMAGRNSVSPRCLWAGSALCVSLLFLSLHFSASTLTETQAQAAPQPSTLQGRLEFVFGDAQDGKTAVSKYFVYAAGKRTELIFSRNPWHGYLGKEVMVTGTLATPQGGGTPAMFVSSILLAPGERAQPPLRAVTGTRKIIMLLVRYSGDLQQPHVSSWYTGIINPSTGNTVNSFYLTSSWGQFGWTADATNWMLLPGSKTTYADCGWSSACAQLTTLFDDAVNAGVANGVNFALYDNIAIVTNNDLDCCAWGGSMVYNGKLYGTVWQPPWSAQQGTFAHELGHSIGLPHSGWVYYAYDSSWDVMSKSSIYNNVACGTYVSANDGGATDTIYCPTPEDHIAPHKDMLGWIDSAHLLTLPAGSSATGVAVDTSVAPLSASRKMLKVCITGYDCTSGGATARYYTVEVRTHYTASPGFDYYLQNEGVILHFYQGDRSAISGPCYFNSQSGPAYPIDNFNIVPAPHYIGSPTCSEWVSGQRRGLYYANWNDGQTFDSGAGFRVQILSHYVSGSVVTYVLNIFPSSITSNSLSGPGGFDFRLSNSAGSSNAGGITAGQGGSGSLTITTALVAGPAQSVGLSCTGGLPSGASCSFSSALGSPTFSSTLTISTLLSTPIGHYMIEVTGTGGGLSRSTLFTLTVVAGPSASASIGVGLGGITVASFALISVRSRYEKKSPQTS